MGLADVPLGDDAPLSVNSIIEIPKGSFMKYEYDNALAQIRLDRVLYSPSFYPVDYGLLPQTLTPGGDHLDVLVLVNGPSFPGCVMTVRPIGVIHMTNENGPDDKIMAVTVADPRFADIDTFAAFSPANRREIGHFFEVYKALENKHVEVVGWSDEIAAHDLITQSHQAWQQKSSNSGQSGIIELGAG